MTYFGSKRSRRCELVFYHTAPWHGSCWLGVWKLSLSLLDTWHCLLWTDVRTYARTYVRTHGHFETGFIRSTLSKSRPKNAVSIHIYAYIYTYICIYIYIYAYICIYIYIYTYICIYIYIHICIFFVNFKRRMPLAYWHFL